MKGFVIPVDGSPFYLEQEWNLKQMQECVGGYIECVQLIRDDRNALDMWINEEGKLQSLAVNHIATGLAAHVIGRDVIVGPALLLESDLRSGDHRGLSEASTPALDALITMAKVLMPDESDDV